MAVIAQAASKGSGPVGAAGGLRGLRGRILPGVLREAVQAWSHGGWGGLVRRSWDSKTPPVWPPSSQLWLRITMGDSKDKEEATTGCSGGGGRESRTPAGGGAVQFRGHGRRDRHRGGHPDRFKWGKYSTRVAVELISLGSESASSAVVILTKPIARLMTIGLIITSIFVACFSGF